jgi:cbb3-type cytochrome oxidase subunit 3
MFENSPLLVLPLAALAIFLGVFVMTFARTYRKRAAEYEGVAALPLADDDKGGES